MSVGGSPASPGNTLALAISPDEGMALGDRCGAAVRTFVGAREGRVPNPGDAWAELDHVARVLTELPEAPLAPDSPRADDASGDPILDTPTAHRTRHATGAGATLSLALPALDSPRVRIEFSLDAAGELDEVEWQDPYDGVGPPVVRITRRGNAWMVALPLDAFARYRVAADGACEDASMPVLVARGGLTVWQFLDSLDPHSPFDRSLRPVENSPAADLPSPSDELEPVLAQQRADTERFLAELPARAQAVAEELARFRQLHREAERFQAGWRALRSAAGRAADALAWRAASPADVASSERIHCPVCGAPAAREANFCSACGQRIARSEPPTPAGG